VQQSDAHQVHQALTLVTENASIILQVKGLQKMTTTSIAIIVIAAALALLGVVVLVVTIVTIPLQQEAEAAGRRFLGCANIGG
jgi:hypothetical protein